MASSPADGGDPIAKQGQGLGQGLDRLKNMEPYTRSELRKHYAGMKDYRLNLHGIVYAVPRHEIEDHPGGSDILLAADNADAAQEFDEIGHSDGTKRRIEAWRVGYMVPEEEAEGGTGEDGAAEEEEDFEWLAASEKTLVEMPVSKWTKHWLQFQHDQRTGKLMAALTGRRPTGELVSSTGALSSKSKQTKRNVRPGQSKLMEDGVQVRNPDALSKGSVKILGLAGWGAVLTGLTAVAVGMTLMKKKQ